MSEEISTVIILVSLLCGFWAIVMVFFACEMGQQYSYAYDEIDGAINQLNWYLFPMKLQRMLPTIMMNMQQPFEIMCFGSTTCNRETFKRVSRQYENQ